MSTLTIEDIRNYLSFQNYKDADNKYKQCNATIRDADSFLLDQIRKNEAKLSILSSSHVLKSNFLSLYNDQYNRNVEIFVGILIVSGVLAKIMFYPI